MDNVEQVEQVELVEAVVPVPVGEERRVELEEGVRDVPLGWGDPALVLAGYGPVQAALGRVLGEAVGFGSMCWSERPAGEFLSVEAAEMVAAVTEWVMGLIEARVAQEVARVIDAGVPQEAVRVESVGDEPVPGDGPPLTAIIKLVGPNGVRSVSLLDEQGRPGGGSAHGVGLSVQWQNGPLGRGADRQEANGAFVEDLLAVVAHRLEVYQGTQFRCHENQVALDKVQRALRMLQERTARREAAAVEGTHEGN